MGITEWVAVLTIFAVIYGLIKRYRQLPAFFYSLPRGSLKTATIA